MTNTREEIRTRIRNLSEAIFKLKQANNINPKHGCWTLYRSYKRQVSILLTALRILMYFNEGIPTKAQVRTAASKGLLNDHCKRGRLAYKAQRMLCKIDNRLNHVIKGLHISCAV
jgi:hypothetical protein